MLFRVCKIENTDLICSRNGTILRFHKRYKKWTVVNGSNKDGYLVINIDGNTYRMHRVIAHAFKILDIHSELMIDHIDLDRSNNCISNFRPATNQQNMFNTNARGYTWFKRDKNWRAQIKLDGRCIYLGYFKTEEEAHNAYLEAKNIYHKL